MADEEDFDRTFLEPLSYSFDSTPDARKDVHMGGDADNKNGRCSLDKLHQVPPYNDLTVQTLKMKNDLNNWKEMILIFKSILLWEKGWYREAIIGTTTIFFTILYLSSPSVLTTFSLIGLLVTLADYFVPVFATNYFKPEHWTKTKDQEFEEICRNFIVYKAKIIFSCQSYYAMRSTKPKLFYPCTIVGLLFLSWLGCRICNWILSFIIITTILILPGLEYHGILKKCGIEFSNTFGSLAEKARQKLNVVMNHHKDD